jgi:hypothetical protein
MRENAGANQLLGMLRGTPDVCPPTGPLCTDVVYANALLNFSPFNEPLVFILLPQDLFLYDDCSLAGASRFACSVSYQLRPTSSIGGPFDVTLRINSGDFFPTCPDDPNSILLFQTTKLVPRDVGDTVTFDIPAPYVQLPEFAWFGIMTTQSDIGAWWGSDAETGTSRGTTVTDRDVVVTNGDGVCSPADYLAVNNGTGTAQVSVAGPELVVTANTGTVGSCCHRDTGLCDANTFYGDCRQVLDVWSQNPVCGPCSACPDPWLAGGVPEGETLCAPNGYVDTYNPGCDGTIDAWTPITCGAANARLGTSGSFAPACTSDANCPPGSTCNVGICTGSSGAVDKDWYQLNLTQDSVVSINVVALFPAVIELRNNGGVAANCPERAQPIKATVGAACSTITLSESLDAGDWNVGVYPQFDRNIPCSSKYRVEVICAAANLSTLKGACCVSGVPGVASCVLITERACLGRNGLFLGVGTTCPVEGATCPGTPSNDECISPTTIASSFSTSVTFRTNFATDSNAGTGVLNGQPACQQVPATPISQMKHDVFYKFQIPSTGFPASPGTTILVGHLVISTLGSQGVDTWVAVYGDAGVASNCASGDLCQNSLERSDGCSDDIAVYPSVAGVGPINDNPQSYIAMVCDQTSGSPRPGDCVMIRVGGHSNQRVADQLGASFEPADFDRGQIQLNIDFIPRDPAPFGSGSSVGKCCQPNGNCEIVIATAPFATAEAYCIDDPLTGPPPQGLGGRFRITTDFQEGGTTTTGLPAIIPEPAIESPGCVTYPCPPAGGACFNALPLNLTAGDPLFGVDFGALTQVVRDQLYYRYKVPSVPPAGIVFDTCDSNFNSVISIYADCNSITGDASLTTGDLIVANNTCGLGDQWYFIFPNQTPPLGDAVGATKHAACFAETGVNDACVCLPTTPGTSMEADSEVIICIGAFPSLPMRPAFTRPSIKPMRNPLLNTLTAVLHITAAPDGCFDCDPVFPPVCIAEGGPNCAHDPTPICNSIFACDDTWNGGCTNTLFPDAFNSPILPCSAVDTMVCGRTGSFSSFVSCNNSTDCRGSETCSGGICTGTRSNFTDEDWYKIEITEPVRLTWRVIHSDAPARILVIQDNDVLDCENLTVLGEAAEVVGCEPPLGTPTTPELVVDVCGRPASQGGPSTYYLFIESAVIGPACDSEYVAAVRCDPYPGRQDCCKADMNNDNKVNGLDIKKWVESFLFPAVLFDEYDGCQSLNTCRADITNDGEISSQDILPFINQLVVSAKPTCPGLPAQCTDPARCQLTGGLATPTSLSDALERSDLDLIVDDRAAECICPTLGTGLITDRIDSLCWWGVYANGFLGDCGQENDCFTVTFYSNVPNQKCPGALLLAPQAVTAVRTPTGDTFGSLTEYMYTATLTTPLTNIVANNCVWVEIVNKTPTSSCAWYWEASGFGDGRHARHNQDPPVGTIPPGGTTWTCTDGADPDLNPDDRRNLDLAICANVRINKFGCGKPIGQCCYRTAAFPGGTIICEDLNEEVCLIVKNGRWNENASCVSGCPVGRCCDLPTGLGGAVRCTAPALADECAAINGVFALGANCGGSPACPKGRCCDYDPVQCVFSETEVECLTRGGIWDGSLPALLNCNAPNNCPLSTCDAFVGPTPPRRCWTPAGTGATGWLSDEDEFGYLANNFAVTVNGSINQICWRGLHQVAGTPNDCAQATTPAETFRITYYRSDQYNVAPLTASVLTTSLGQPARFDVTPSRISAGNFQTSILWKYEYIHTPVPVSSGVCYWVEVVNTTVAPDCLWFWHNSNQGDDRHASRDTETNPNSAYSYRGDELTMCMGPTTLQYSLTTCTINAPVPPNDTCAQGQAGSFALVLGVPFEGTTISAVDDTAGLDCPGNGGAGPDVYYNFTPVLNGQHTLKLCPTPPNPAGVSQYDAVLSIHGPPNGPACPANAINTIGCDDDGCGAVGGPSIVSVGNLSTANTYSVRVSGWGGAFGTFSVVVTQP